MSPLMTLAAALACVLAAAVGTSGRILNEIRVTETVRSAPGVKDFANALEIKTEK
jgi:hypothetical protein